MSNIAVNWALKQTVNKSGAKFVLFILADHADAKGGSCFPRISQIAKVTEQDERTVRRHLDHLENIGLISRYRARLKNGYLSSYNYKLNLDEEHQTEIEPPADILSRGQIDQRTNCPLPPDKMSALDNLQYNPHIKNKKDFEFLVVDNFGDTKEIKDQINACWDYWMAYPDKMPSGDMVAAFRGWMRNAKPRQGLSGDKAGRSQRQSGKSIGGASLAETDRKRVQDFYDNGFWLPQWGPKPNEPRCQILPSVLKEFKNQPERKTANV